MPITWNKYNEQKLEILLDSLNIVHLKRVVNLKILKVFIVLSFRWSSIYKHYVYLDFKRTTVESDQGK